MDNPAIEVWNLSKTYRLYGNPWHRVLESLPGAKRQRHKAVHALKDVNFHVPSGTCVGLVGGNGAGKSTLLKILTGTTFPTGGGFRIRGRIASLLELGAGFNRDFTGKENIFMNAALMGFSRREAMKKYDEILDFSELGEFIHAPIRTYSSGMVCRLGFSVAVATDPDVLIIDEILAVGDMHFRRKCVDRIMSYRERGKTMFFCSHSLYDVRQICEKAIWMRAGEVQMYDDAVAVTNDTTWTGTGSPSRRLADLSWLSAPDSAAIGQPLTIRGTIQSGHVVALFLSDRVDHVDLPWSEVPLMLDASTAWPVATLTSTLPDFILTVPHRPELVGYAAHWQGVSMGSTLGAEFTNARTVHLR